MAPAPRFHCAATLAPGASMELPAGAARHAQVLRLQPGASITLFGGPPGAAGGGEFAATVTAMGRHSVQVQIGLHSSIEREAVHRMVLAIGIPANERMDWLVEKATELGVAEIQPLMTQRSVVRLDAERGLRKLAHWQSIAIAACEQCGRNRVPVVHPPLALGQWLKGQAKEARGGHLSLVLSLHPEAVPMRQWSENLPAVQTEIRLLCGPEGGLGADEEALAVQAGCQPVSLGARVLRAETAALAALTLLA